MNSIVSYRNLLKTRGDPPRGVYKGGRAGACSITVAVKALAREIAML